MKRHLTGKQTPRTRLSAKALREEKRRTEARQVEHVAHAGIAKVVRRIRGAKASIVVSVVTAPPMEGAPSREALARAEVRLPEMEDWLEAKIAGARQRGYDLSLPSPDQYARRFAEYAQQWNVCHWNSGVMLCPRCGRRAAKPDARAQFCSDTCSAAARNRGRQKVGGGRSAQETARARGTKLSTRHFASHKTCPAMRPGGSCAKLEAILRGQMAIEESPARARQYHRELGHEED